MIAFRIALVSGLMLAASSAFAEHGGSADDQLACTPDVYRLCASQIPDEDAIVACLKKNRAALSPACGKVFSKPNPGATNDDDN